MERGPMENNKHYQGLAQEMFENGELELESIIIAHLTNQAFSTRQVYWGVQQTQCSTSLTCRHRPAFINLPATCYQAPLAAMTGKPGAP